MKNKNKIQPFPKKKRHCPKSSSYVIHFSYRVVWLEEQSQMSENKEIAGREGS